MLLGKKRVSKGENAFFASICCLLALGEVKLTVLVLSLGEKVGCGEYAGARHACRLAPHALPGRRAAQ